MYIDVHVFQITNVQSAETQVMAETTTERSDYEVYQAIGMLCSMRDIPVVGCNPYIYIHVFIILCMYIVSKLCKVGITTCILYNPIYQL